MAHTYTYIYTPDTGARIYIRKIFNKSFYIYLKNTLLCLKYLLNKDFKKKNMRLDKFLKVSRIIKRRTVANEACDTGRVQINGRPAKAGTQVKEGDVVVLFFGDKQFSFRILDVKETVKKQECQDMYEVINE